MSVVGSPQHNSEARIDAERAQLITASSLPGAHRERRAAKIAASAVAYDAALSGERAAKKAAAVWPTRGSIWTYADFWEWLNSDCEGVKRRRTGTGQYRW